MTLFVRHSAWLDTVPDKQSKARRETRSTQMPPLDGGEHLVGLLFEIGPVTPGAMGAMAPISDQDLRAWQLNQGVKLTPWECRTLRELSRAYCGQLAESRDVHCPPPWIPPVVASPDTRPAVASGFEKWAAMLNQQRGVTADVQQKE